MESYYRLYIQSGGIMMFFLIPCSLLAIAYIVQGYVNLRRTRLLPPDLAKLADKNHELPPLENVKERIQESESLLALILQRVLNNDESHVPTTDEITEAVEDEVSRIYQKNSHLTVIYTVAPLLGLLGTVIGMMKSFYLFSAMSNPSVTQLGRGINEALVTTMWGLFIAIPSFVVVNIFRYRLLRYERDILPHLVRTILQRIAGSHGQEPVSPPAPEKPDAKPYEPDVEPDEPDVEPEE